MRVSSTAATPPSPANQSSRLSASEQRELQGRMEKKQMKEFMNMYSNLVQQCFDNCVNGFESKSLTSREEGCIMRCVDKHMKGSQRLGDRFQEQNAAMAQSGGAIGRYVLWLGSWAHGNLSLSTSSMTDALKPLVDSLQFKDTAHSYFTAPSGPKSINNEDDAAESVHHCLPALEKALPQHDGFLVACYSKHPLVSRLKVHAAITSSRKPITGIFEASVAYSLQIIHPDESFGIVSTGKVWEKILSDAVVDFLGTGSAASKRFAGVETTGLNATDLHDAPKEEVRRRMKDAVKRLLGKGKVGAICLGCAGMAGMDEIVREACVEELREVEGGRVRIMDGVVAGAL